MFNFFKKKNDKIENIEQSIDNPPIVSITYNINHNLETNVDIAMDDYGPESIDAMCRLLDTLSNDRFYVETVNMLKQGLINDDQQEVLLTILTHVGQQARYKIIQSSKDSIKDEPCIKPSDML
jgi:alpha-galactosidase/6-phospho-beta-glucosidase family protein